MWTYIGHFTRLNLRYLLECVVGISYYFIIAHCQVAEPQDAQDKVTADASVVNDTDPKVCAESSSEDSKETSG